MAKSVPSGKVESVARALAELPDRTESAGRAVQASVGSTHKAQFGQFFTPPEVAHVLARLSSLRRDTIRFLDAGAGAGALTAAWLSEVCRRATRPRKIHVVAFEVDERLHTTLRQTLDTCAEAAGNAGIQLDYVIRGDDFIAAGVNVLEGGLFSESGLQFDVAVINPPYKKFRADSAPRLELRRIGVDTSNLYAAFVSLTVALLTEGGELIAITPRSFCNGPYFRQLRTQLLSSTCLDYFQVSRSRSTAFRTDRVLQENVIFRLIRGVPQGVTVRIEEGDFPGDPSATIRDVPFVEVVYPGDAGAFVHLAPSVEGRDLAEAVKSLPATLDDLGLTVSTGRVVDFRAREWLRPMPSSNTVPLVYPQHFSEGRIVWPKVPSKKANAIVANDDTGKLMVPTGYYALVKRFSSKEERRRITAAVIAPDMVPGEAFGFENHLNYYHRDGMPLSRDEARGMAAFLNSTQVDLYFRQFNGHTQVNATDLRSLRYPTLRQINELGMLGGKGNPPQEVIDSAVNDLLGAVR